MNYRLDYSRVIDQYPIKATVTAEIKRSKKHSVADLTVCGIVGHPEFPDVPALFPLVNLDLPLTGSLDEQAHLLELENYTNSLLPFLNLVVANGGNTHPRSFPTTPEPSRSNLRAERVGQKIVESRGQNQRYRTEIARFHFEESNIERVIQDQMRGKYPEAVIEEYLLANFYNFMRSMGVRGLRDGLLEYMQEKTMMGRELVDKWTREYDYTENVSLNQDAPTSREEFEQYSTPSSGNLQEHLRKRLLTTTTSLTRSKLIL